MIKLYVLKIDESNEDILLDKVSLLSFEEKNRVLKYRHDEDRARSAAGKLMLFCFADRFKEEKYKEINFVSLDDLCEENLSSLETYYKENGKGYVKDSDNLYFNISHSKDYSICALSDSEVGVDIQEIRDINEKIARRFFSEKDNEYIEDEMYDKRDRFIKVWTVKESYAKLTGRGIAQGLETFFEDFENNKIMSVSENSVIGGFTEFAVDKGYYCFASFFV